MAASSAVTDADMGMQASSIFEESDAPPELIVIGLQEVCAANSLSAPPPPIPLRTLAAGIHSIEILLSLLEKLLGYSMFNWDFSRHRRLVDKWQRALQYAIGQRYPTQRFHLCCNINNGPTAMFVFASAHLKLAACHVGFANCGWLSGLGWNKSAVACSVETTAVPGKRQRLLFINAHLAAHEGRVEQRNANYRRIISRLCLYDNHGDRLDVNTVDFCLFMGDLNYRLALSRDEFNQLTSSSNVDNSNDKQQGLLRFDELTEQRRLKRAFVEFHEPPVQFAPSYKFNRNGQYDSRKRMPAWCDRCLFTGEPVVRWYGVPESSRRLAGVYSDHLPVA
jgi:endonuclease/exonuclease/phosphatase family metal-dependent hydrolase